MVIGLTGGPATGKSLATAEFKRLGAAVVDADVISRQVTQKGSAVCAEITREFGAGILQKDGSIDRKALGRVVFSDGEKRKRLNEITHPAIIARIREEVAVFKKNSRLIVVDAPLLFEAALDKEMDKTVVVFADEEKQIKRIVNRDGLGSDEAKRIIASQMPLSEKAGKADYRIDNNGAKEKTLEAVRELYEKLCRKTG